METSESAGLGAKDCPGFSWYFQIPAESQLSATLKSLPRTLILPLGLGRIPWKPWFRSGKPRRDQRGDRGGEWNSKASCKRRTLRRGTQRILSHLSAPSRELKPRDWFGGSEIQSHAPTLVLGSGVVGSETVLRGTEALDSQRTHLEHQPLPVAAATLVPSASEAVTVPRASDESILSMESQAPPPDAWIGQYEIIRQLG